jgi:hypothetical protein
MYICHLFHLLYNLSDKDRLWLCENSIIQHRKQVSGRNIVSCLWKNHLVIYILFWCWGQNKVLGIDFSQIFSSKFLKNKLAVNIVMILFKFC